MAEASARNIGKTGRRGLTLAIWSQVGAAAWYALHHPRALARQARRRCRTQRVVLVGRRSSPGYGSALDPYEPARVCGAWREPWHTDRDAQKASEFYRLSWQPGERLAAGLSLAQLKDSGVVERACPSG
jgi:hypothetical protein